MQNYFLHPANDKMKAKKAIQPGELQVKHHNEICLLVQWLKLCASTEGVTGSIPGQESKISHTLRCGQKISAINRNEIIAINLPGWLKFKKQTVPKAGRDVEQPEVSQIVVGIQPLSHV